LFEVHPISQVDDILEDSGCTEKDDI
jgi:hypothetical protein